jgi:hypothetical protein
VTHLGSRISALVDGELDHESRDRALAHVAHCAECRDHLDAERTVKELLAATADPTPPDRVLTALHGLARPGGPLPPRARTMPQGPVVPVLPPPGRYRRTERVGNRPATYSSQRRSRRVRVAAAGTLSLASLLLVTAFAAGGQGRPSAPVVPPSAELSVEHTATTVGITVGDPGLGAAGGLADTAPTDTPGR